MIRRSPLRRKYAFYFVAFVTVALVASGAVSVYFTYQETKAALLELQREKATAAAGRIEAYVQEIDHQLGWMRLPNIDSLTLDQRRIEYLKLLRQVPAITDVSYIDTEGNEKLKVSRVGMDVSDANMNYSQDPRFTGARGSKSYFSAVYFRKDTEPYMTISVAMTGREGGVTAVEVNLKFIWDVISRIRIGERGLAYAVDGRGQLIAHPDISLVLQKTDFSGLEQVKAARAGASGPGGAGEQVAIAQGFRGGEVLTAYANIPELGWAVFVEQPREEAFAPLYASLRRTGYLLLLGLVFAIGVSLLLAQRMVTPIRALQEGAARIGEGNLDQQIVVRTGDELEELAGQFNSMAGQLQESYAGLEQKVEARTRELSESLTQQTATAEILRVISSTPTDTQPVFDAIVQSGLNVFPGGRVAIALLEGDGVHVRAATGLSSEATLTEVIVPASYESAIGTAIVDGRTVNILDTEAPDAPIHARDNGRKLGFRAIAVAPMMREGQAIGAINVLSKEPGGFTEKQMVILKTFADQAVIAIENVRLFREIQDKSRQLEAANLHKSEFLANMSHELRTPLNAIIGFSEVLQQKMFGEMNEKQAEYIDDIHSSGKHLLSLINDILDLSKVEAGRTELDLAEFGVRDAIDSARLLVRERAQRQGIELADDIDSEVGTIIGDERKFKQILLNLMSNAVKFTPQGGRVTLGAHRFNDHIEVSVTDTGVGIAPEDQGKVFEAFQQVGTDIMRKAEGTGLGLTLTRKFVELHGGKLELESEVGKGSRFYFTLPLVAKAASVEG